MRKIVNASTQPPFIDIEIGDVFTDCNTIAELQNPNIISTRQNICWQFYLSAEQGIFGQGDIASLIVAIDQCLPYWPEAQQ